MKISYSWALQPFTFRAITFAQYPVSNKASYIHHQHVEHSHGEKPSRDTRRNRTSHPRDDHPPLGAAFWGVFWLPSSLSLSSHVRAHTCTHTHTYILTYIRRNGGGGLRDGATVRGCWCVQSTPVKPRADRSINRG